MKPICTPPTMGWGPKDIEGAYEHITPEMRRLPNIPRMIYRGPLLIMQGASDHCGRGRFRTADILLVRQALYP